LVLTTRLKESSPTPAVIPTLWSAPSSQTNNACVSAPLSSQASYKQGLNVLAPMSSFSRTWTWGPTPSLPAAPWPCTSRFLAPGRGDPLHPAGPWPCTSPESRVHHHAHRTLPPPGPPIQPDGEPPSAKLLHTPGIRRRAP
jgi:hypothetical protein